jgi:hypothetical protein
MDFEQPAEISGYVHETKDFGSRLERDVEFVSLHLSVSYYFETFHELFYFHKLVR